MVSPDQKIANAVGGKTARACDSCLRKRARWYCPADDAFLCQGCDASVHSANPLARRHERVRLKTASLKVSLETSLPSWQRGFTRKPRTPRNGNKQPFRKTSKSEELSIQILNPLHLVPEIGADEATSQEDNEEQLLYRVPVFDPFAAQLCLSASSNEVDGKTFGAEAETADVGDNHESRNMFDLNSLNCLSLPSDMELAEFAADVESLLGKGLDEESFDMEKLGFLECTERNSPQSGERVKVEEKEEEEEEEEVICQVDVDKREIDLMREPFQLNFDYESPLWDDEDDQKVLQEGCGDMVIVKEDKELLYRESGDDHGSKKRKILRLDYQGVIAAWDDQRSPWTSGDRPELDPTDCWPNCMGSCGIIQHQPYGGEMGMMMGNPAMMDGGREARVSRYREKRRTRLFSKKIRYEVRKLNAEKRPRMKGRFVKRANFAAAPTGLIPLLSK